MQEIIRRCDVPVKRGRETVPHGEVVPDDLPTPFALEGVAYEGDFCEDHRTELRESLAKFIAVSTEVPRGSGSAVRRALKGKQGGFTQKDVRKWLLDQGRDVAPSGRLPNEVIEEYRAAHS